MDRSEKLAEPADCVNCGCRMDMVGPVGHKQTAQPGDPVLCIMCGMVMTVEAGQLRPLTVFEARQIRADPKLMEEIRRALGALHIVWAARN